jgi:hypothetical protein
MHPRLLGLLVCGDMRVCPMFNGAAIEFHGVISCPLGTSVCEREGLEMVGGRILKSSLEISVLRSQTLNLSAGGTANQRGDKTAMASTMLT